MMNKRLVTNQTEVLLKLLDIKKSQVISELNNIKQQSILSYELSTLLTFFNTIDLDFLNTPNSVYISFKIKDKKYGSIQAKYVSNALAELIDYLSVLINDLFTKENITRYNNLYLYTMDYFFTVKKLESIL